MNKFVLVSLFVTSAVCIAGFCHAMDKNVTEEKVECAYITAKKARMHHPMVGGDMFKLQLPSNYDIISYLDEEEDCPVPTTPPVKK